MAAFPEADYSYKYVSESEEHSVQVMNMDEGTTKDKTSNDALSTSVPEWLNTINLSQYSEKFLDNGYDDLQQLIKMHSVDLAEVSRDVDLVTKKGHLKRFYAAIEELKNVSGAKVKQLENNSGEVTHRISLKQQGGIFDRIVLKDTSISFCKRRQYILKHAFFNYESPM